MGFFDNFVKKMTNTMAKNKISKEVSGFNKSEIKNFMQASNSLASSRSTQRVEDITPEFQKKRISFASPNPLTKDYSQDQVDNMVEAFRRRQSDVLTRKSMPGISSQTRLS